MLGFFLIKWEFAVELDLYCDLYFSYIPCKHRVTGDVQFEDLFPTYSML